jgi:hypothetical protein
MLLLLDDSIQQYNLQQRLSDKQITSQLTIGKATTLTSSVYAKKLNNESINQLLIILLVFFWSIERVLSERFTKNEGMNKQNEENNSIPLTDSFTSLSDRERKA